ncbi:MAG: hypothetical protein ABSG54_11915 [Terriglobia bacterium]|jgi:hypothetical protein
MKLILRVSSSNQYCDGGCEFAVVDLTRELASVALRRIQVLKEHKKDDELVYETYYWAFHAEYFSPRADLSSVPEKVKIAMQVAAEIVEALEVEEKEVITAPDDFEAVEAQIAAVECEQMVVCEDGIAFLAIPKHCDFYVTTAEIPVPVLHDAAGIDKTETLQKTAS